MKTGPLLAIFAITAFGVGCEPVVTPVESVPEPAPTRSEAPAPVQTPPEDPKRNSEPRFEEPVPTGEEETSIYTVLTDPWGKYFRSDPQILLVPEVSQGVDALLLEKQKLIQAVLDSGAATDSTSDYAELNERISELKLAIPEAETSSGYVRSNLRYGTRSYVSGSTVYINRSGYYGRTYRIFQEKHQSSSPALVRSVQNIAHNTTLEDIDQRVEALQQIIHTWTSRNAYLSVNGTEGIMREADEAYLSGLKNMSRNSSISKKVCGKSSRSSRSPVTIARPFLENGRPSRRTACPSSWST